jgi:hypothetical protein
MHNETHVRNNAAAIHIQSFFTTLPTIKTFVEYDCNVNNITVIDADKSVKYIGLWINDPTVNYQQDWATIRNKQVYNQEYELKFGPYAGLNVETEEPTQDELDDAEGPVGPDRDMARKSITMKAQAWVERIDGAYQQAQWNWIWDNGIANGIAGIQYHHPKYSAGGDLNTSEWPPWVQVTTYMGEYPNRPADGAWMFGGNVFGGLQHPGTGVVSVPKGLQPNEIRPILAHEAGHSTKDFFHRQIFGPSLDHSTDPGLMDKDRSLPNFTEREQKILRGMKEIP